MQHTLLRLLRLLRLSRLLRLLRATAQHECNTMMLCRIPHQKALNPKRNKRNNFFVQHERNKRNKRVALVLRSINRRAIVCVTHLEVL